MVVGGVGQVSMNGPNPLFSKGDALASFSLISSLTCIDSQVEELLLASCSRPWLLPPHWPQGWAHMKTVLLEPGWPQ